MSLSRRPSYTHTYGNSQYIFNVMQGFPNHNLIIDVRDTDAYDSLYLNRSINLPYNSKFSASPSVAELEQFMRGEVKLFARRKRFMILIVYSPPGIVFARELEFILRRAKCREVYILDEEFEVFSQNYQFLSRGPAAGPSNRPKNGYPNEIAPFKLYIGDKYHAGDPVVIKDMKITHIVNATRSFLPQFEAKGVVYLNIVLDDLETEDISQHFEASFTFIERAIQLDYGRVLVHCAQGISRSATIVIMYLMVSRCIDFDEAYEFVRKHRNVAAPNVGFVQQLKGWAASRSLLTATLL